MRCPKCGFISFDHLTSCAKCGKDIADVASELQGTSINVEAPMFLSGALAAYADRGEPFADQGMGFDVDEGIDFSMDEQSIAQEPIETAEAEGDVDVSFAGEREEVDISMAEDETEEAVDFTIEAEAEVGAGPGKTEESLEELDFMGAIDEEEGGLEFDLDDFIEDMDDDNLEKSSSEDIDIDIDDEDK